MELADCDHPEGGPADPSGRTHITTPTKYDT